LQLGNEAAAPFIEKNTVLCIHTESCVKEKLQHNNKVEFVFLRTDGHPFCELVVVPTPPTPLQLHNFGDPALQNNSGSSFLQLHSKAGNDEDGKTTQFF
jgi:hypothetical protein